MTTYFIYVLRNQQGRLYIGFTENLEQRVWQHGENEASWTRGKGPWELVHHEEYSNRADTLRRERNLKRGRTNQILRDRFGLPHR